MLVYQSVISICGGLYLEFVAVDFTQFCWSRPCKKIQATDGLANLCHTYAQFVCIIFGAPNFTKTKRRPARKSCEKLRGWELA